MKGLINLGFVLMVLGAGGTAGAIETGNGWILSLVAFAVGAGLLVYYSNKEEYEKDGKRVLHSTGIDASRVSYLR